MPFNTLRVTGLMSVPAFILTVALVATGISSPSGVRAATPTVRTITFAKGSSVLTASAKKSLGQWKSSLDLASKITVTGFAPSAGRITAQRKLAIDRALSVATQIKKIGITATITRKVSLLPSSTSKQTQTDKATILITALKPIASPSSSASPSNSASPTSSTSPSASPSESSVSKFKSSGSIILDFVDCNQSQKQVAGTSITFTSTTSGADPVIVELTDTNTGHAANNMMNCEITWKDVELQVGNYSVSIQAKCIEIPDSDTSVRDACTPSKYLLPDLQTQTSPPLTGSGPTSASGDYTMSFNLPENIELTQDVSVNYEAYLF